MNREAVLPFSIMESVEKSVFSSVRRDEPPYMGNPKGISLKVHTDEKPPVFNPYPYTFLSVWTDSGGMLPAPPGNSACRDGHIPADRIILRRPSPPERRPIPPPFLTPAHRLPCSGVSRAGAALLRRLVFRTLLLCVLQPLPDGRLFSRPAFCRFLCFLPGSAVIDNPVDHTVVILQGHFRSAEGIVLFRLHGDRYDLPAQADELFRLPEVFRVFLRQLRGQGAKSSPSSPTTRKVPAMIS